MKIDHTHVPAFTVSLLFLLYNIYDRNIRGIVIMRCLTLLWLLLMIFIKPFK